MRSRSGLSDSTVAIEVYPETACSPGATTRGLESRHRTRQADLRSGQIHLPSSPSISAGRTWRSALSAVHQPIQRDLDLHEGRGRLHRRPNADRCFFNVLERRASSSVFRAIGLLPHWPLSRRHWHSCCCCCAGCDGDQLAPVAYAMGAQRRSTSSGSIACRFRPRISTRRSSASPREPARGPTRRPVPTEMPSVPQPILRRGAHALGNRGLFCTLPCLVRDAARRRGQPGPAPLADNDAVDRRLADTEPLSDLRPPDAATLEPQDVIHRTAGVRLAASPEARGHSGQCGEPGLDAIRPLEDAIRPTALLV